MDILGAVAKAVEMVIGHGSTRHDQIAAYLSEIAREAESFAQIWSDIASEYAKGVDDPWLDPAFVEKVYNVIDRRFLPVQGGTFRQLDYFYRNFTSTVGGEVADRYSDGIINHLGRLLDNRRLARSSIDDALRTAWRPILLHAPQERLPVETVAALAEAMHADAATLKAIATSYAASKG